MIHDVIRVSSRLFEVVSKRRKFIISNSKLKASSPPQAPQNAEVSQREEERVFNLLSLLIFSSYFLCETSAFCGACGGERGFSSAGFRLTPLHQPEACTIFAAKVGFTNTISRSDR
jgi:hypothetical protein